MELPFWKTQAILEKTPKTLIFTALIIVLLSVVSLCNPLLGRTLLNFSTRSAFEPAEGGSSETNGTNCDIFTGEWVPNPEAPYYTNRTCDAIHDHQNCMKYGRPDTGFTKWRWKPERCELPLFDPLRFLDTVRNKSMAFVGDSVGRTTCSPSSASCPRDRFQLKIWLGMDFSTRKSNHQYISSSRVLQIEGGLGGNEEKKEKKDKKRKERKKNWDRSSQVTTRMRALLFFLLLPSPLPLLSFLLPLSQFLHGSPNFFFFFLFLPCPRPFSFFPLPSSSPSRVGTPVDVSYSPDEYFKRWHYTSHNFTLASFWTPFLVKSKQSDSDGPTHTSLFTLYLDDPDPEWTTQISDFDYLILSAGHWFFRPSIYIRRRVAGCRYCLLPNVTDLPIQFGYRNAFRTALRAIILNRLYRAQVEEFWAAAEEGKRRSITYRLMDTTRPMLMRPDGHPSRYGHWPSENVTLYNDCVHWCLPGPIDAWNDFLLEFWKNPFHNRSSKVILFIYTFTLLALVPIYLHKIFPLLLDNINALMSRFQAKKFTPVLGSPTVNKNVSERTSLGEDCDLFKGNWIPYFGGSYYTNETKCYIDSRQNCQKHGRPDTEYLNWRWKPERCELPLFDATQFLQLRWFFKEYNFTLAQLWSTHLVKTNYVTPWTEVPNDLYLDVADERWVGEIENFDFVIISSGQWFLRPLRSYEKGKLIGCHLCKEANGTNRGLYYAYRKAFRTSFRTLLSLPNFKGEIILRTITVSHVDHRKRKWNEAGDCTMTRPVTREEMKIDDIVSELYSIQLEELMDAQREGRKKGLKFRVLNVTEAMALRPDGHPSRYGHWPHEIVHSRVDCVHWCLPGPIDAWNEIMLQMMKM
ncbi:hypothetical protein NMG60_11028543 [Bertholletia excelsa]